MKALMILTAVIQAMLTLLVVRKCLADRRHHMRKSLREREALFEKTPQSGEPRSISELIQFTEAAEARGKRGMQPWG